MIVDSHMHVGEYPFFNVSLDRDGLVAEMRAHGVDVGLVFDWDNERIRAVIEETPGVHGLVWADPLPMHSKIRVAVERVGADRVLYGSDTPFHHPSVKLTKVRVSGMPSDLTDRILGENGRALFLGEHAFEVV